LIESTGDQVIIFGPPYNLDLTDGRNLAQDSQRWITIILSVYQEGGTVSLTEEAISKLLSADFAGKLDPLIRDDLNDGVTCILHLIPTPGAMVLLRVAENAARKYSKKLTGKSATKKAWGEILDELEKVPETKKAVLGYLHYLKGKRNEAQHPEKRFTQEEAEKVFIQVKDLLDELASL